MIQKIKAQLKGSDVVVGVGSIESSGANAIPQAATQYIADELGIEADQRIIQSTSPKRTELSGIQRILNRPQFDGEVKPNAIYVLVDDTVAQGGTLAGLAKHIQDNGASVGSIVALTGKEYSATLALQPETLAEVRSKFGDLENDFRGATGYGFDQLTQSEGRYLAKLRGVDAARQELAAGIGAKAGQPAQADDQGRQGLTTQTKAEIEAKQDQEANAPQAQQREQIRKESEIGDSTFMTGFDGDARQDTTENLFLEATSSLKDVYDVRPTADYAVDERISDQIPRAERNAVRTVQDLGQQRQGPVAESILGKLGTEKEPTDRARVARSRQRVSEALKQAEQSSANRGASGKRFSKTNDKPTGNTVSAINQSLKDEGLDKNNIKVVQSLSEADAKGLEDGRLSEVVVGGAQSDAPKKMTAKSKKERDERYMKAVESGDMEAAQRMVDLAAVDAGYMGSADYKMSHTAPDRESGTNLVDLRETDRKSNRTRAIMAQVWVITSLRAEGYLGTCGWASCPRYVGMTFLGTARRNVPRSDGDPLS